MKNLFLTFICFGFLLTSCIEDDESDTTASTFEVSVDFVSSDGLNANVLIDNEIPRDVEITDGEVPLIFLLDPETGAFEPIPVTFFPEDDLFAEYRFNFTVAPLSQGGEIVDIELVLESNDFDALDPVFTDNQVFRIVIVPSFFAEANPDISFEELQSQLDLDIEPLKN